MSARDARSVMLLTRFDALGAAESERLVARLQEERSAIDREPRHIPYRILHDRDDMKVSFVLEEWRTQKDLNGQRTRSRAIEASKAARALLIRPPITVSVTMVEQRSRNGIAQ